MKTRIVTAVLTGAAILVVGSPVQAELQGRDLDGDPTTSEAYYDTDLNITWLADANYAATQYAESGGTVGDEDGIMTWWDAKAWVESLVYWGVAGWRLPTNIDTGEPGCNFAYAGTDCGYSVQTKDGTTVYSEMAHLWYVTLGNLAYCDTTPYCPQPGWGNNTNGPFLNAPGPADPIAYFWYGTTDATRSDYAWIFRFNYGDQHVASKWAQWGVVYAWPVRDGDVDGLLQEFALKIAEVAGCQNVTGTVTISEPAPPEGVLIALSDTLVSADTPDTVKIAAGKTTKNFPVTTEAVETGETGTVSATLGSKTLSQNLTVRPIGMLTLTLSPTTVVGSKPVEGTAKLECKAAPGPVTVDLSSSKPEVANPVAASIAIPQGLQSAPFEVSTSMVLSKTTATISGTANGITKSKTLTVTSAASVSPTSLKFGNVVINTTSGVLGTTLYNKGAVSYAIDGITLTGSNAKYYAQTNDCGATLDAGASCTIGVTFTPIFTGTKSAKLVIATSATATPLSVSLSGTGVLP